MLRLLLGAIVLGVECLVMGVCDVSVKGLVGPGLRPSWWSAGCVRSVLLVTIYCMIVACSLITVCS